MACKKISPVINKLTRRQKRNLRNKRRKKKKREEMIDNYKINLFVTESKILNNTWDGIVKKDCPWETDIKEIEDNYFYKVLKFLKIY